MLLQLERKGFGVNDARGQNPHGLTDELRQDERQQCRVMFQSRNIQGMIQLEDSCRDSINRNVFLVANAFDVVTRLVEFEPAVEFVCTICAERPSQDWRRLAQPKSRSRRSPGIQFAM